MTPGPGTPAHTAPRKRRHSWRVALWLLPVLLLHALVLYALVRALPPVAPDAPPPVLYTRMLLPQAPPAPAAPGTAGATAPGSPAPPAPAHGATLLAAPARPASAPPAAAARRQTRGPVQHVAQAPAAAPRASPASAPGPAPAASAASAASSAPAPGASAASTAPAPAVAGSPWPVSTRLDFALGGYYRGALHGNGELEWRREGARYLLRLSGSALIDFSYTSSGRIDGAWLAPEQYVEQVLLRRKTVDFDRTAGLLRFSAISTTLPITPHLQDSASVFMQLSQALRERPQDFAAGRELHLLVARPSGTTTWTFRIAGRDTVQTGLGRLDCWHLIYDPPADADLGAQVWLAPALQDLPVQIRLSHGHDDYLLFTLRHALQ